MGWARAARRCASIGSGKIILKEKDFRKELREN